jgi:hypothetical protein
MFYHLGGEKTTGRGEEGGLIGLLCSRTGKKKVSGTIV